MAPPRTPKLLMTACLLFSVAACGGVNAREGSAAMGVGNPAAQPAAAQASGDLQFGANHRFASGITVSLSAPQSFQPSPAAYPRSARAAAFYIQVTNNGTDPYRVSALSVTATVAGKPHEADRGRHAGPWRRFRRRERPDAGPVYAGHARFRGLRPTVPGWPCRCGRALVSPPSSRIAETPELLSSP